MPGPAPILDRVARAFSWTHCRRGDVSSAGSSDQGSRPDAPGPGAEFRPWLLAIVANEARSRARGGQRAARLLERAAALPAPHAVSVEEAALARAGTDELLAAIGRLSEPDRQLLCLRFVLDLGECLRIRTGEQGSPAIG